MRELATEIHSNREAAELLRETQALFESRRVKRFPPGGEEEEGKMEKTEGELKAERAERAYSRAKVAMDLSKSQP